MRPYGIRKSSWRRKREKATRLLILLLTGLFFSVLLWSVTRFLENEIFFIADVSIRGTTSYSRSMEVARAVEGILSENTLFPQRHFLFFPVKRIQTAVSALPFVLGVEKIGVSNQRAVIFVKERLPVGVYCPTPQHCFLLDDMGIVFEEVFEKDKYSFLPVFSGGIEWNDWKKLTFPQPVFSAPWIRQSLAIMNFLNQDGRRVEYISIDNTGDIFFSLRGGVKILTSVDISYEEFVENFLTLTSSEAFRSDVETFGWSNIDYIDFRFGKKVFYKIKDNV